MAARPIKIAEENSPRKVFVWAIDWPGWCRSGRDLGSAHEALLAAADRYALVAAGAGIEFPPVFKFEPGAKFLTVAQVEGGSGTAFGVPSVIIDDDRRAVNSAEAARLAAIVASSWSVFDATASAAPETLRKGPRGGDATPQ